MLIYNRQDGIITTEHGIIATHVTNSYAVQIVYMPHNSSGKMIVLGTIPRNLEDEKRKYTVCSDDAVIIAKQIIYKLSLGIMYPVFRYEITSDGLEITTGRTTTKTSFASMQAELVKERWEQR